MRRVYTNGPGGQGSYQRLKKCYLMPPCLALSIMRFRINDKVKGMELCPPLHHGVVAIEKGAFGSPSTKVTNLLKRELFTLSENEITFFSETPSVY